MRALHSEHLVRMYVEVFQIIKPFYHIYYFESSHLNQLNSEHFEHHDLSLYLKFILVYV